MICTAKVLMFSETAFVKCNPSTLDRFEKRFVLDPELSRIWEICTPGANLNGRSECHLRDWIFLFGYSQIVCIT